MSSPSAYVLLTQSTEQRQPSCPTQLLTILDYRCQRWTGSNSAPSSPWPSTGQLLGRGPGARHGPVQRLGTRRPAREGARRHPHRPGHQRPHRGGPRGRRAGPTHRGRVRALDSDVASMRDVVSGSVRLGVIGTTARWLVPRSSTELERRYPEVSVVVLDATTSSLVLQLCVGQLDLAVVNLPVDDPELVTEPLFDEDRSWSCRRATRCTTATSIDLDELAEHELLLEAPGTTFRDDLDEERGRGGHQLRARGRVRRHAPAGLARVRGLRRRCSSRPAPRRIRLEGDVATHPDRRHPGSFGRPRSPPAGPPERRRNAPRVQVLATSSPARRRNVAGVYPAS